MLAITDVSPGWPLLCLYHARPRTSLVLHDLSSGTDRTLALGGDGRIHDPFITPDGKRVLYTWCIKDDVSELRIVNLDGTGMRTAHAQRRVRVV